MAIEAERLLAIFEAKFDALDKALAKSRAAANQNFSAIEAAGNKAENTLAKIGSRGTPGIDRAAKSIQNVKVQTSNLAAQLNDIGVQLAGGQSPFLIALQQGTQINQALGDAGAKGAMSALGGAFMSLINPVGLATIAIITLGGAAIQYFQSLLSDGEKSAEQLQKEASLIQQVAAKWGDALPALKAYAEERQKLADQKAISEATQIGKEGAFEDTRSQVNNLRSDLAQLIADLSTMGGQEEQVGRLQSAFKELDDKVKDQSATAEDAQRVQQVLADILQNTGMPAADALSAAFSRLAAAIATASGAAKNFTFDERIKDSVLSPLGTIPPVFSGGGGFQDENQVQTDRANATKSQYQIEQERLARRGGGRSQRLTADDRINENIQSIRDRTAALEQEASMLGLSFEEQQRRKVALDLEQQALKQLREEAIRKGQTDLDSIKLSPDQVAAINQVAKAAGAELRVIGIEVDRPTRDFTMEPAMQPDEFLAAFNIGCRSVPADADLLAVGEMGIGNTSAAALLCTALLGGSAGDWVGRGTGVDDEGLARKVTAIETAIARHRSILGDPLAVATALGGRELAAMAGAVLAARRHRIPVILDGFVATAAMLPLANLNNRILDHCQSGHVSAEAAHRALLSKLGLRPLLDLDMRLGEASGAGVAILLARAAVACHAGMATFSEAGVSSATA